MGENHLMLTAGPASLVSQPGGGLSGGLAIQVTFGSFAALRVSGLDFVYSQTLGRDG
jgi:hypothetical protein